MTHIFSRSGKFSWYVLVISHPALFSLQPRVFRHFTPQRRVYDSVSPGLFLTLCFVIHVLEASLDLSLELLRDIKFSTHIFNFFLVLCLFVNSILFLDYEHAIFSLIFLRLYLIFCCFVHGCFL